MNFLDITSVGIGAMICNYKDGFTLEMKFESSVTLKALIDDFPCTI